MLKYLSFFGRATRQEYWAIQIIFPIIILLITSVLFGAFVAFSETNSNGEVLIEAWADAWVNAVLSVFGIPLLWLNLAVAVRRLRDAGLSSWWVLLSVVPIIGVIPWIIWGCLRSKD